MRGISNQIWVTSVLTEGDVEGALVLCRSLKGVLTTRNVAVIVSSGVSPKARELLNKTFDLLFFLEEDRNTANLKVEEYVKLFTLTLHSFDICLYLSPHMMIMRNCDEIFHLYKGFEGIVLPQDKTMDIFMIRPSLPIFKDLMVNLAKTKNGHALRDYLETWTEKEYGTCHFLDKNYYTTICSDNEKIIGKPRNYTIINFAQNPLTTPSLKACDKMNILEQKCVEKWWEIYEKDVKPLFTQNDVNASPHKPTILNEKDAIAIVGMSARHPGAKTMDEFWSLLFAGKDGTGIPPSFRWLKEQCSRNRPDCRKTNAGFLSVPVDEFDAKFFGISPKEMTFMDPQHRLLHEIVWEGLEDAGINPEILRGTNGSVFIGSWMNDYKDILVHSGCTEFYRMYMGNSIGACAARISFLLGMTGPSIATESGCSSAMVAVHLACQSLQRGETNMALACGVNLLLHPFDKDEMPMVISPDGRCKTFDATADGFARAEGCGVLVLKRLSDAVKDNDNIWGVIRGSGVSQEGLSKSMGTPTIHSESLAMELALENAQVKPEMVSYVEAHGTGTAVGDPMEIAAIAKAYHSKNRVNPLIIGSVKTNVGHTESCSGITGIIKVILSMHHQVIPPHVNFNTLNPAIDLTTVPAQIPLEAIPWKQSETPRIAGVSSFGITGTDGHVIIQEPPTIPNNVKFSFENEKSQHILAISAKTEEALELLLEKYKNHLLSSENSLPDIAYTTAIGRAHFAHRAAIIGPTKESLVSAITQKKIVTGDIAATVGKICFLFTGQGSQYPQMAHLLYQTSPTFRIHFDHCEKILQRYQIHLKDTLWSVNSTEISRTIYSQTSIFCVEYALLKLWESWGVKPDYVLGHSLGEFAAAVCAGIISVTDAVKLVAERSRLIDNLPGGKMLVILANKDKVNNLMKTFANDDLAKFLDFAAVNSEQQTVVAGDSNVVLEFKEFCTGANLKCILLDASHAFHSRHMDPILNQYKTVAQSVKNLHDYHCQYISSVHGDILDCDQINAQYWVDHTRGKVQFLQASKKAVELGCEIFIEIGPQPVLSALTLMNSYAPLICLPSLKRNEDNWTTLLNAVAKLYVKGVAIDWEGFDQFYSRRKVRLPHYPFIGKKFWPDMMAVTGTTIHPLVGSLIPNASSTKLFQNNVNLRVLEYVKDHAIGTHAIFPGAGYLELCLAAGLATVEGCVDSLSKPRRAMKVENLTIEAPLLLQESKSCQLQTVVDYNTGNKQDWNDLNVKIFHRLDADLSSVKWVGHAQATFSPLTTAEDKDVQVNLKWFQETLQKESDTQEITDVYNKLATLGLKFGPSFRSLEKVWRDENSLLAKVKVPAEETGQGCIVHPVVLDAMIQAVMMLQHVSNLKKKIYVPIKIEKFVWLSAPVTEDIYIHAYHSAGDTAILLDGNGTTLAVMSQVEFIDTTVRAVESVLEQQTVSLPGMWECIWRPTLGPMQYRVDGSTDAQFCTPEFHAEMAAKYNDNPPTEMETTFSQLETLVYYHMLQALYECDWNPELNKVYNEDSLFMELEIKSEFRKYFGFFLDIFAEEGIFQKVSETDWKLICSPPTQTEIKNSLASLQSALVPKFECTLLLSKLGVNLSGIFKGTTSSLSILFPDTKQDYPSVGDLYVEMAKCFNIDKILEAVCTKSLSCTKVALNDTKAVLRILEVGAGTGLYTNIFLEQLEATGPEYEYTFTDISSAFFSEAEKRFEKFAKNIKFKKFNIEQDPISQGFTPGYYELACASDVIHATRDIRESLKNIAMLLRPRGRFDMLEVTRVHRFVTFLFGVLNGYWRFEDFDLRPKHSTIDKATWVKAFGESGFHVAGLFSAFRDYHSLICAQKFDCDKLIEYNPLEKTTVWVIFDLPGVIIPAQLKRKIEECTNRKCFTVVAGQSLQVDNDTFVVNPQISLIPLMEAISKKNVKVEGIIYCWALDKNSQDQVLHPYFNVVHAIQHLKQNTTPSLICITNGAVSVGDTDNFHPSTLLGFTKSLKNESSDMHCRCIDMTNEQWDETLIQEVFYELWNTDKGTQVAYNKRIRYVPKFQEHKPILNDLKLPAGADRFQLKLPESKSIDDLQFEPLEPEVIDGTSVEVQVKASALNFRDVFAVMKPIEAFANVSSVGFDFAGVVSKIGEKVSRWQVGDTVFGINMHGTPFPSHIKLAETSVQKVPDGVTLCEAATVPAVFATAYDCLVNVAKIKSSDNVLIHAASGGVGLAAVQICQKIGATIIATAGSTRKQNYLRSLGIRHIFHSRNTQYGDQILTATQGRGVDVVLNSLTSEGFKEASLAACAKNARFVEMSKLSIWSENEVKALRPDVNYTIVDLSTMSWEEMQPLMAIGHDWVESGALKPLPYVRFDGLSIRDALKYLQKAKQIGKVVCTMPQVRNEGGNVVEYTPMFNDKSTYLITGGLGGIGFEVCKWMVAKGAKYILLGSRNDPSDTMKEAIAHLNKNGENVTPVKLDCSDFTQCKKLLDNLESMNYPPLRGVMHAAGTLADGFIANQTWEKFSSTLATKVTGTVNLHELTKSCNLEHFVLFSSIAALFGPPGQGNHAAGNNFEDVFAHYRHSTGLPATTVNWGQWGEVGVATEVEIPGVKPFSTLQGIAALEYAMKSQRVQTCVVNIESFVILCKMFPELTAYLDERVWKSKSSSGCHVIKSDEFWQQYDTQSEYGDKVKVVKDALSDILRFILKLEDCDVIDENCNLQEMGVDSLMFVEIKNSLQALVGERITVNASSLRDCSTVNLLGEKLVQLIEGDDIEVNLEPPTAQEVIELLREDCHLGEHISSKEGQHLGKICDIKCALLTGSTGTLGPYILKELSQLAQITQLICIIRAPKSGSVEDRLRSVLNTNDLSSQVDMSKIKCISGNVSQPNLGLDAEIWKELCDSVDAVFHCAASVQHVEFYRRNGSTSANDMRAVNITGTRNILEFCCTKKLKRVFYSSTIIAAATVDEGKCLSEKWPELSDYDGVTTMCYPITKFVGDYLMKQAGERGIPVKAFRFPFIIGNSKTGAFQLDGNHVMLRYFFILKNGIMPSNPMPIASMPVDICSQISIKLFFNENCSNDIYNICHPHPYTDQEFQQIAQRLGFNVDIVEFSEFAQRVRETTTEQAAFAIFKELYRNDEDLLSHYTTVPALKYWLEGNEQFWVSKKVGRILPDVYNNMESPLEWMFNDFMFAKKQGWFDKFSL